MTSGWIGTRADGAAALESLAASADVGDAMNALQARDVARTTLLAAAEQLVRLAPDDALASTILRAPDVVRVAAGDSLTAGSRRVVWF